jgi:pimeloyl-ACP methyl ester carboxylesterase
MTSYRMLDVNDREIFYREAGDPSAAPLLLLHGFLSSSAQCERLMRGLAGSFT